MNKTILYLVSNLFLGPTIFIFVIMLRIRVPYIQRVWYPHRNIKYFWRFEKFSIWVWISFCCTKIYFEFLLSNRNIFMHFQISIGNYGTISKNQTMVSSGCVFDLTSVILTLKADQVSHPILVEFNQDSKPIE